MADLSRPSLARTHPLQTHGAAFASLAPAVSITTEPFVATVDVRVADPTPQVAAALGIDLPTTANTWRPGPTGWAVWLGPDEWLLTDTTATPEALEARTRAAVLPAGGTATDVSAQRIGIRVQGVHARTLLAKGCSIDLHPRVFGLGHAAQSTLGRAGVVLLGLSDTGDDFAVLVRSSFAGYLGDWLLDAALEFTAAPAA